MASAVRCRDQGESARGVTSDYISALLGAAATARLSARLGVAADAGGMIGFVDAWKLLTANVALTNDEGHQLAAAPVRQGNFELLMASMVQGDTLAEGLTRLAEGANIIRPDLVFRLSRRAGSLRLSLRSAGPSSRATEVYVEALIVVIHCATRWALGRPLDPVRLRGPIELADAGGSLLDVLNRRCSGTAPASR